ncbi:MAG: substrate-binding domain-containing protein [Dehalococcoidia bacterium]|nr:substrate-binding domain-containing protein [Dehalococcoidia bacterium]
MGQTVYRFADSVAAAHSDLQAALHALDACRRVEVRIAASSYYGASVLATERMRNEDPDYTVSFRSADPPTASALIRSGEVDFGFFGDSFSMDGLSFDEVQVSHIAVVTPPTHELSGRSLTFADLTGYPLVGYAGGSAKAAIDRWLHEHPGHQVSFVAQSDSSPAIKSLAIAMGSPALVVREAVLEELASGALVALDVVDFNVCFPLYVVYASVEDLGPAARRYREHLLRLWSKPDTRTAQRPGSEGAIRLKTMIS